MTVTARRVVSPRRARTAFDGEGARLHGGRWTSPGRAVVYVAATTSLALLETLVHAPSTLLPAYVAIPVTFDAKLVSTIEIASLPRRWRSHPFPAALRRIGDEWLASGVSAALRVPSAVVPEESNFLLNPAHPDFPRISIGSPVALDVDFRLRA